MFPPTIMFPHWIFFHLEYVVPWKKMFPLEDALLEETVQLFNHFRGKNSREKSAEYYSSLKLRNISPFEYDFFLKYFSPRIVCAL